MAKPAFDLILGVETLSKLGIVLDFQTKTITVDESILPMRNIDNLSTAAEIERAWSVNNRIGTEFENSGRNSAGICNLVFIALILHCTDDRKSHKFFCSGSRPELV
jgi:hypothetical protein